MPALGGSATLSPLPWVWLSVFKACPGTVQLCNLRLNLQKNFGSSPLHSGPVLMNWLTWKSFVTGMPAPSVVPHFSSPQLDDVTSWLGHGRGLSLQTCLAITGLWLTLVMDMRPALLIWVPWDTAPWQWGGCPAALAVTLSSWLTFFYGPARFCCSLTSR